MEEHNPKKKKHRSGGRVRVRENLREAEGLTNGGQRTNSSIVLSRQVFLVANRAHAISPRVTIETTTCGTERRDWALIGLLGHSNVCHQLISWRETDKL